MWRNAQKRRWERATAEFVPYFEKALELDRNSSDFLILCLRVLELPSLALKFTLPEQKGVSQGKANLSNKLRKVESLTMQIGYMRRVRFCFHMGLLLLLRSFLIAYRNFIHR